MSLPVIKSVFTQEWVDSVVADFDVALGDTSERISREALLDAVRQLVVYVAELSDRVLLEITPAVEDLQLQIEQVSQSVSVGTISDLAESLDKLTQFAALVNPGVWQQIDTPDPRG